MHTRILGFLLSKKSLEFISNNQTVVSLVTFGIECFLQMISEDPGGNELGACLQEQEASRYSHKKKQAGNDIWKGEWEFLQKPAISEESRKVFRWFSKEATERWAKD